jgi:Ala-tRNA(Pro) deacylase
MAVENEQERLFKRLSELGIAVTPAAPYPAHKTVEEGKALRGQMAGTFTKNILLQDKKGRLFIVVAREDRAIDLKTLHGRIGASGRVRFASPEQMRSVLGVAPGALTPLAIINDSDSLVTVVIDADLMAAEQLNFHPMVQTQSVGLSPADLSAFIRSCGRIPHVVNVVAEGG